MAGGENAAKLNKNISLYQKLYEDISNGVLGHGERILPERALADKYAVSRETVRSSMQRLEADGLIVRQRGRGTFVSGAGRNGGKRHIGLIWPLSGKDSMESGYVTEVYMTAHHCSLSMGFSFELLMPTGGELFYTAIARQGVDIGSFDGFLFLGNISQSEFDYLNSHNMKFVATSAPCFDAEFSYVGVNDYTGIELAMRSLFERGRRNLLFFNGSEEFHFNQVKSEAFRNILESNGIAFAPGMICEITPNDEFSAISAIRECMERRAGFDGMIVYGDWATWGVLKTLRECNIAVPQDVALVMYDDFSWVGRVCGMKISCIRQPFGSLIREALKMLIRRIENSGSGNTIQLLSPQWIAGETC